MATRGDDDTLVVGAGWSGLAAALRLARAGHRVTLIEAAPRAGGRARTVDRDGAALDNGQHLFIGAYHATLTLLDSLGVPENIAFERHPLHLVLHDRERGPLEIAAPRALPAPLHLTWALMRGLAGPERRAALGLAVGLWRRGFAVAADEPLGGFLARHGQPAALVRRLWEPLCLATLNTPVATASTRLFLTVLRDAFGRRRRDSDLLFARRDLSALLVRPALTELAEHGAVVVTGRRATGLEADDEGMMVTLRGGESYRAAHCILATPPAATVRLLADLPAMAATAARLDALAASPIATVYLEYPEDVGLEPPLLGLTGTTTQWLIDRGTLGQPGLIAAVVSAGGPHEDWTRAALAETVAAEIAAVLPHWPRPRSATVIREKRATFVARSGVDTLRPATATDVPGLWLAGDYTATGYPATLEGAVRSGVECADQIIHRRRQGG